MTLLTAAEVPRGRNVLCYRQTGRANAIAFWASLGLTMAIFANLIWPGYLGRPIPPVLIYLIGGSMAVFTLLARVYARAAGRPTNWSLRAGPDGLCVNLRSYLNAQFPADDRIVAFVPSTDVVWLRERIDYQKRPTSDHGSVPVKCKWLEIKLRAGDISDLKARIADELSRQGPGRGASRSRTNHAPVQVTPDGLVRVEMPSPARAVKRLGRIYRVEPKLVTRAQDFASLSRSDQEARIVEAACTGDTMTAVKLAKRLYSHDTTEAKRFVDDLIGR